MVTQKQNKTIHGLMRGVNWPKRHTRLTPSLLQTMLEFTAGCRPSSMDTLQGKGGISGWNSVNLYLSA